MGRSGPAAMEALEPRLLLSVSDGTTDALVANLLAGAPSTGQIVVPAAAGDATGEIRGVLWNDADASGLWDGAESALVDWRVYLDTDDDAAWDPDEPYQLSGTGGSYAFAGLAAGTYTVRADAPDGWTHTSGDSGRAISEFDIDVIFIDDTLTPDQQAVFSAAAQRWEQIIIGDLPEATTSMGLVDDVAIQASAPEIDGAGNILGMAGPITLRSGSYLPATGIMMFDSVDLGTLENSGQFVDVIVHEMGHVLGFGTIWDDLGLLTTGGDAGPRFTGTAATAEYAALTGQGEIFVPVADTGGSGTINSHWRESVFNNELMTGYLDFGMVNPISRVTAGSLADLGYEVDLNAADAYILPAGIQAGARVAGEATGLAGRTIALNIAPTFVEAAAPSIRLTTDLHVGDHHVVELGDDEVAAGIDFGYWEQPLTSDAPGLPDLLPISDTGASDSDDLTRRDNSTGDETLRFEVPSTQAGATVTVYADGQLIGTADGADGVTIVETTGLAELADGERSITARQTAPGQLESPDSAALTVTVDTAAPSVSAFGLSSTSASWRIGTIDSSVWTTGRAQPTAPWSAVNVLVVSFDEPVTAAGDDMTVQGQTLGAVSVAGAAGVGPARVAWTVAGTAGGFLALDRYTVAVSGGVTDMAGNALAGAWETELALLPGDVNGDGEVGSLDRQAVRNGYGWELGASGYSMLPDVNGDAIIGSLDRQIVRNTYGQSLPPAPAPQSLTQPLVRPAAPKPVTPSVVTRPAGRLRDLRVIRRYIRRILRASRRRPTPFASHLIRRLMTALIAHLR